MEALRLHARTPDRFEAARTQLCHGEALRRARLRARAREPLRAAIEAFDAVPEPLTAAYARLRAAEVALRAQGLRADVAGLLGRAAEAAGLWRSGKV